VETSSSRAFLLRNPKTRKSAMVDFLFALLATRNLASWSIEPSCSYLTNTRDVKDNDGLTSFSHFSHLATTQVGASSLRAPTSRTSETREANRMLTPSQAMCVHPSAMRAPPDGCTTCSHEPQTLGTSRLLRSKVAPSNLRTPELLVYDISSEF
jgi:hypothetical protein